MGSPSGSARVSGWPSTRAAVSAARGPDDLVARAAGRRRGVLLTAATSPAATRTSSAAAAAAAAARGASDAPPRRGLATARHGGVGRPPTRRADLIILRFRRLRAAGVMLRGLDLVQRALLLRRVEHAPAQRQGAPHRAVHRLGHQGRRHVVRRRGRDQVGGGRWRARPRATRSTPTSRRACSSSASRRSSSSRPSTRPSRPATRGSTARTRSSRRWPLEAG